MTKPLLFQMRRNPQDDAFPRLLGTAVHEFQTVELLMKSILSRILEGNSKMVGITISYLAISELLRALTSCTAQSNIEQNLKENIDSIYPRLNKLIERRNLLVHSYYGEKLTGGKLKRMGVVRGKRSDFVEEDAEVEILDFLNGIASIRDELLKFHSDAFPNQEVSFL